MPADNIESVTKDLGEWLRRYRDLLAQLEKLHTRLQGIHSVSARRGLCLGAAARYVGMHRLELCKEIDRGRIPCQRYGRRTLFFLEDLDRFLNSLEPWRSSRSSILY